MNGEPKLTKFTSRGRVAEVPEECFVHMEQLGFVPNDSFQACLASVANVSISDLPQFVSDAWFEEAHLMASGIGFRCELIRNKALIHSTRVVIAVGLRGNARSTVHCCLWLNGSILHDPHPTKPGLAFAPSVFLEVKKP